MHGFFKKQLVLLAALSFSCMPSAHSQIETQAQTKTYNAGVTKTRVHKSTTTAKSSSYWARHPKVKSAAVGAGVGTAAGAATGLITHRGVARGAMIGAGTGAGVGLVHSSKTMQRHPIAKDTATGAAAGLGLGMIAGRGHHSAAKGAAVGGAVGLGIGLLKNKLK